MDDEIQLRLRLLEDKMAKIEEKISQLEVKIAVIQSQNNTIEMILKYVVTPLIVIIGGLVGINITVR